MIEEGVLAFPVYDALLFKGVDERLEFPTEEVNIALLLVELSFDAIIDSINDDELLDGFEARLEFTNKVSRYDELLLDGLKLGNRVLPKDEVLLLKVIAFVMFDTILTVGAVLELGWKDGAISDTVVLFLFELDGVDLSLIFELM